VSDVTWNFAGRTAIVTGAAGGIGAAVVRKLAAAGATVVFSDLQEEAGRALERELSDGGANVRFVASDATDEAQVKGLVEEALAFGGGKLDIAINNVGGIARFAGDRPRLPVHEIELSAWQASVDLNLTSAFLGVKNQVVPMMAAGKGAIVNFTSLAGLRFSDGSSVAYAAAKAGVVMLTEYAAVLYGPHGIRVNVVAPGFTLTPPILKAFPDPEVREQRARAFPLRRLIYPDDLADACLWACSDASSAVTGLTIPVDGGRMVT
jgi:NAD(P)-dependent dehydrogenase (short-subunit alcohol dehydrogenase family)